MLSPAQKTIVNIGVKKEDTFCFAAGLCGKLILPLVLRLVHMKRCSGTQL